MPSYQSPPTPINCDVGRQQPTLRNTAPEPITVLSYSTAVPRIHLSIMHGAGVVARALSSVGRTNLDHFSAWLEDLLHHPHTICGCWQVGCRGPQGSSEQRRQHRYCRKRLPNEEVEQSPIRPSPGPRWTGALGGGGRKK